MRREWTENLMGEKRQNLNFLCNYKKEKPIKMDQGGAMWSVVWREC